MAIVRAPNDSEIIRYLATVALFCGISCTILMLKFRGFKASLNLSSGKRRGKEHYELAPQVSVGGAYRTSKYEYFGNDNYLDPPRKITPSMVKLPPNAYEATNIKPSRSTGDLSKVSNVPGELHKSTPNVGASVSNATQTSKDSKNVLKEQKRLEKERLSDLKKREKLAAQERDKQEKLRKEREKQEHQQIKAKELEKQRKMKTNAPQPHKKTPPQQKDTTPQSKIVASQQKVELKPSGAALKQNAPPPPPLPNQQLEPNASSLFQRVQYSTNTLESSISRSSGPPPYSDVPEIKVNKSDNSTGNISFAKPVEESSWDMISEHRQQMSRTTATTSNKSKQTRLDLHYNVGNLTIDDRDNSEA